MTITMTRANTHHAAEGSQPEIHNHGCRDESGHKPLPNMSQPSEHVDLRMEEAALYPRENPDAPLAHAVALSVSMAMP